MWKLLVCFVNNLSSGCLWLSSIPFIGSSSPVHIFIILFLDYLCYAVLKQKFPTRGLWLASVPWTILSCEVKPQSMGKAYLFMFLVWWLGATCRQNIEQNVEQNIRVIPKENGQRGSASRYNSGLRFHLEPCQSHTGWKIEPWITSHLLSLELTSIVLLTTHWPELITWPHRLAGVYYVPGRWEARRVRWAYLLGTTIYLVPSTEPGKK